MIEKYKPEYVFGVDDHYIDYAAFEVPVHREIVNPFLRLQAHARALGFELSIASGYRNFERQLLIWNDKVEGNRPVLDSDGKPLLRGHLCDWEWVQAILRWSALPGASRHHWGTDIDIYDRSAVATDYRVQLSVAEVSTGGPFEPLHNWLDVVISEGQAEGFYRPYSEDRGGIAPERWHLSFGPCAASFEAGLSVAGLSEFLASQPLLLKAVVLANIEEIFDRFILLPGMAV